jgi:hypothetical protein
VAAINLQASTARKAKFFEAWERDETMLQGVDS